MIIDLFLFPAFVVLLCLVGLGFGGSARVLLRTPTAELPAFSLSLFGLFSIGFVSLLLNFVTGVNGAIYYLALLPFIAIGLFSLNKENVRAFKIIALIAVLITPLAAYMAPGYDGGLYHLPHQKWIRDEAIVVGLANLHGRFGFSSFQEYIDAPLWVRDHFKLLSYVQASFFVSFLVFIYQSISSGPALLRAITALIAINLVIYNKYIPWLYCSTDPAAGLVFAICFLLGLNLLIQRDDYSLSRVGVSAKPGAAKIDNSTLLFIFLMLAVMSVTLKPSSVLIAVWVVVVVVQLLRLGWVKPARLAVISVLPILFLVFWLLRGVLTTGCLLYPASWSCLGVVWSAKAKAINIANMVTAWARHPHSGLSSLEGWSWLWNYWLQAHKGFLVGLGLASAAVLIVGALARSYFQFERNHGKVVVSGIVVIFLVLALWFLKAPNPRFGIGAFLLAAPLVAVFVFGAPVNGNLKVWRMIGIVLVGLLILRNDGLGRTTLRRLMQYDPLSVPTVEVVPDKNFGVRPRNGDQCWLAKHCAPYGRPSPTKTWGHLTFIPQQKSRT